MLAIARGPYPSLSMAPGRKPSMTTSASASSSSNRFLPSADLRFSSAVRLPMLPSSWKKGTSLRCGQLILSTSAPYSARIRPMVGAAMMRLTSSTLIPASGRLCAASPVGFMGRRKGAGGVVVSMASTLQGGELEFALPF